MIKLPVKDPDTVPWMSKREIPAIKAVLSAWRALRRDNTLVDGAKDIASFGDKNNAERSAERTAESVAWSLECIAAIDARLRKEARDGTGHKK